MRDRAPDGSRDGGLRFVATHLSLSLRSCTSSPSSLPPRSPGAVKAFSIAAAEVAGSPALFASLEGAGVPQSLEDCSRPWRSSLPAG